MSITQDSIWPAQPSTTRGSAVHLSYDKKSDRLVYASGRSIFLRSVSKPEESRQYVNHTTYTTVAKFSPSGFYVASGDDCGNIKVWDAVGDDMVTKGEYTVISGRINDLDWDADSQRIIAVGDGKERYGHCFTADSGNTVGEISGHTEVVNAVSIRPVRPYRAATVSDDNNLVFYQGPPFKFNFTSRGNHSGFVLDVRFSHDGAHILTVGADHKIAKYDGKTGEFISLIENDHTGGIMAVAWSSDSKKFATCSADGSVKLWDFETGKNLKTWSFPRSLENQQVGVVFAGDERIISLSLSGDLNYFLVSKVDPERIVKGHQKSITAIEYHDGKVYSGSYDGRVLRWKSDEPEDIKGKGHTGLVVGVQGGKDGELWTVGWDDQLKHVITDQFDSSTALDSQPKAFSVVNETCYVCLENSVEVFEKAKKTGSISLPITATSLSANEQYVAVGYNNNSIEIFKTADLKSHGKIQSLISSPSYLSFSHDGKYLAVGLVNGKIILYDFAGLSVVTSRWAFHSSRITSMSWHKNSQYVVSGSVDSNIFVYSVEKPGMNLKVMGAHKDGVNGVVWTGENGFASAGADATIKNWIAKFT